MTAREEKVLAVAREVWKKSTPSDERVEAAAQRIARRMRIASSRTTRRPLGYLAFAVVLIGALAYAASGGLSNESGPRRTQQTPAVPAVTQGDGNAVAREPVSGALRAKSTPTPNEATSAKPTSPATGSGSVAANGKHKKGTAPDPEAAAAAAASSWREVDQALGAKDDSRAEKALTGLASSDDPTTRAKAKLGLAQLARSQKDCPRAATLANEVIATPNVDPAVVKRAQSIAKACH